MKNFNNRTPGPTNFPPEVYEVLNRPIISHRSIQFKHILQRTSERLQTLLNTKNTPMFLTSSGTGGLEAALLNTLHANSKVLSLSNGYYGDLWANIAQKYVPNSVTKKVFPSGQAITPEQVKEILHHNTFDIILLTHSESSTGVLNPLSEITAVIKENSEALILVDAISSVGTTPYDMDAWNIDVLITVSQKGLMAPPGLAIICASTRAIQKAQNKHTLGSFYFDFPSFLESAKNNQTPTTPNILGLFGVDAALIKMEKEGIDEVYARHQKVSNMCQKGIINLGLKLFAHEDFRAPGITTFHLPDTLSAIHAQEYLEHTCGLGLATGLGDLTNCILRIGHMGWVDENDIQQTIQALSQWRQSSQIF